MLTLLKGSNMYHYVYRITNVVENRHYYGKRSSKISPKEDLGVKYFSSSSDKNFITDQQVNPKNYEYVIVSEHATAEEALEVETYLHNYFQVDVNEKFYNKAKQTSVKFTYESKGYNNHRAFPIDIYNYYTGELVATNVLSSIWCKENNYDNSALIKTIKGNSNKPHCATKGPKYNLCHTKGIYAVVHGDKGCNKFSKEHVEASKLNRKGHNHCRSIAVDVYDHYTDNLVAHNVVASNWASANSIAVGCLLYTLKGDRSKKHIASNDPSKRNYTHFKGYYLRYSE